MQVRMVVGLLASVAAACGDGDGRGTGGPDGGTQMVPRVTVVTGVSPALIAYRQEGDSAWKTPASPSTGTFELEVAGPYRVVVVCQASHSTFVVQYARTLDDERTLEHPCEHTGTFPLHVRGQMLQSGEVFFGGAGRGQSVAPWSFDLPASAGTFDFLAFFGTLGRGFDEIAIRRDVAIAADLDLGTIDVAQEHTQALVPTRYTATNLAADESLSSSVSLQSGNTFVFTDVFTHPEPAWQVNLVPQAALRATDTQYVQLVASSSSTGDPVQQRMRSITRRARDDGSTSVTLMEPVGQTTFVATADRLVATWASLPACDEIDVSRVSFSSDFSQFVSHDLLLSHAFLAGAGTTTTLDLSDVPGFRPEWRHDPALDQVFGLDAFLGTFPEDAMAEVRQDLAAPAEAASFAPRRADAQRAMLETHRTEVQRMRSRPAR